jgi:arylsulfatase A-like enzyme
VNRRQFLATPALATAALAAPVRRPNVVFILTDDQGYGDVGIHGNDKIRTPNMDRVAREGIQFTQFHANPVCSPTRASLMTGRYYYRTGVVDTYLGRSMMYPDEVTVAEMLAPAGYRTGIFGKWHLGDNYPLRAIDQGFQDAVVIKGGGLRQPAGIPGGDGYFDPILLNNGKPQRYQGYCTDIYTDEALKFMERNRTRPFFLYLPTNAPHGPLEIGDSWVEPYRKMGLSDTTAKIYGMVANVDHNIGRVLAKLSELKLEQDTIVIFMTDNGPQQGDRFNGGMRGRKGTVYEGGIRVPFFVRWPRMVQPGTKTDRLAAHIDVLPTLLDACGAPLPGSVTELALSPLAVTFARSRDPRPPPHVHRLDARQDRAEHGPHRRAQSAVPAR